MKFLEHDELPALQAYLQKVVPLQKSLRVQGYITILLHAGVELVNIRIAVDRWPDVRAIAVLPHPSQRLQPQDWLYVYALQEEAAVPLVDSLQLDWTLPRSLMGINENIFSALKQFVMEKSGVTLYDYPMHTLLRPKDMPLPERCLPAAYHESTLKITDLPQLLINWKFGGERVSNEVAEFSVRHMPTVAIRDSEGNLVAYEMQYLFGTMGALFVSPQHRGQGLANFVVTALSRKLQQLGRPVFCSSEPYNNVSISLHSKLGFEVVKGGDVRYAMLNKKD